MSDIPNTFCPAKWDELSLNLTNNYVYSCCKAKPVKFLNKKDIMSALDTQKHNLLTGIKDTSCDYCWLVEDGGHKSLRYDYLDRFDNSLINGYINNTVMPNSLEVNIGNECNFQCTYCNPKFSSQWENDVKQKEYKVHSDKFFYALNKEKNNKMIDESIAWAQEQNPKMLRIIGGEPLLSKNFFKLVNNINSESLTLTTNLSCETSTIDKLFKLSKNYKKIHLTISIDSTKKIAEFTRYGMDYEKLLNNINYVLTNLPKNVDVRFISAITSITIRDFNNIVDVIDNFYQKNPNQIDWLLIYVVDPKIFTLNTLHEKYKPDILETINKIKDRKYIKGLTALEGAIKQSKFNKTLYGQMKHFLEEFSTRKKVDIPVILE